MKLSDNNTWKQSRQDNPFRVPENYFEDFRSDIMAKIKEKPAQTGTPLIRWPVVKWISGVAAALLLAVVGFQQFYLKPQQDIRKEEDTYSLIEYFAQELEDMTMTEFSAENGLLNMDDHHESVDLLNWMGIDEMSLIEAVIEN